MPKKENSAGEMQNYNPETGRYEGGTSGGGESKKEDKKLSSFKKEPSEFDKNNAKRMGKKSKVEDWQISEALADFEWQITSETTVGQYAQETADRLGIDKEDVLAMMKKELQKELKEDDNLARIWFGEDIDDEEADEEGVGSVISYVPAARQEDGSFKQTAKPVRAKKLNNGLAVETKAMGKEHIYAGNKGKYKVVDVESGLIAGYVSSYEDALKLSKDKEFVEKLNRARESMRRRRKDD